MNIVKPANKKCKKQIPNLNLLSIEIESMKAVCFKNNLKD